MRIFTLTNTGNNLEEYFLVRDKDFVLEHSITKFMIGNIEVDSPKVSQYFVKGSVISSKDIDRKSMRFQGDYGSNEYYWGIELNLDQPLKRRLFKLVEENTLNKIPESLMNDTIDYLIELEEKN